MLVWIRGALKRDLAAAAAENGRTLSQEVGARVERSLTGEKPTSDIIDDLDRQIAEHRAYAQKAEARLDAMRARLERLEERINSPWLWA